VQAHPVDKFLEQHCCKSAAGLLQLVRFEACLTLSKIFVAQTKWVTAKL
jgi:hypothetical protein